ncbi:MAG: succinylglutamate desuccinylase/aspartoacylase family protein [Candidatus Dormibacteraeota bacterium]|nr:succinylglutamate desuccinylase/aspartoacylase family protein [Candidatus Dormibacteraeota bacterium]
MSRESAEWAPSPVTSDVEFERPGRQVGDLRIPQSTDTSAWGQLLIPIVCVAQGEGPTVLVTAGNHGDEPEGQIAALKLARSLRPQQVRGRVIVIPCLSPPAARAFTRSWPSGENFNRVFPGSPAGTPAQMLADYLTRTLLPRCDALIDLHSGGTSLRCLPWSEVHLVPDPAQRAAMVDAMLAWNADWSVAYIDVAGAGLLVSEAEAQGKVVIGTELGGGGPVPAAIHRLAYEGLVNVLRHLGVLDGEVRTRAGAGLAPTTVLRATDPDDYLMAPAAGLAEHLVELGDRIEKGQAVARIHRLDDLAGPPVDVVAKTGGVVCALRAPAPTERGECVCVVGQVADRASLLAEGAV